MTKLLGRFLREFFSFASSKRLMTSTCWTCSLEENVNASSSTMLFTLLKFLVTMECCAPRIARNRVNLAFFSWLVMIVVLVKELRAPPWAPCNNHNGNSCRLTRLFVRITRTSHWSISLAQKHWDSHSHSDWKLDIITECTWSNQFKQEYVQTKRNVQCHWLTSL